MSAVITCILALKDRFGSSSTFLTRSDSEGSRRSIEAKIQRSLTSPIMSEPSTPSFGVDPYSPSRVFQLKQGYTDLPDCKISDLMKSTSLENAPTQSLLGVVNSILDESIERKNGQIPYRIACLLRKVIAEIERRISTQAGHIRNQNNLIKAREEKYQSRIKVLEALAGGAHGQTNVEKGKLEGKGQLGEEDVVRLMKYEEDFVRLMKEKEDMIRLLKEKDDMIRLLKEKEDMVRLLKVKEDNVDLKNDNGDNTQRMLDENKERLLKEKDDTVVRLTKEKEEMGRMLKEKDDIILLMKETKDMVNLKDVMIGGTQRTLDENKDRLLKEKDDIVVQLRKEKGNMIKLLEEKENTIRLMKEKENNVNIESDKIEDRKQAIEDNRDMLIKENNDILAKLIAEKEEITKLLKEKEDIIKLMKEKEGRAEAKKDNAEDRKQSTGEDEGRSLEEKGDIIRLIKEKEDYSNTILKLKKELESLRSSYEESCKLLESKKEDIVKVLTDKKMNDNIILQLRQDLETTKKLHEAHCEQLETAAAQANKKSEQRIKEIELMLEDSTSRKRELEELSESRIQFWKQKELVVNQFIGLQINNVQDLRLSSVSVRHEILNCQKIWLQELSGLGENIKMVTNAAEKYHATLADNRKLFNEIQELKGNIRVYCRIRPFRPTEDEKSTSIEYIGENGELTLSNPAKKGKEGGKNFTFNKVFGPATTQDMVFKDIQPLIRSVLDGYNVCIFAYGQTGSGKTYTMMGPDNATEKEWGVNYRALNDLFSISHDRRETIKYELGVQMVEIYNEQIRDLLDSGGSQKKLGIQNTTQPNGLAVPDATMCPVTSTPHVIELMQTGHNNRSMSATAMNERSSRSHSVVTIHVQGQDLKTKNTLRGALHLVDLAGSERVDRSAVTGDRLKEAQHINKSLAALGDVIFSLSQKNSHVPYRNSKLTQVLQTSLGGHAKTLMFVQVNPDVLSYTETLSTLKFAERVSGVELGAARTNKEGKDVRELMDQISMLKDTISKKDEEIDRLQAVNTSTSRLKSTRTDSLLKHSSSSPGMTSLGKVSSFGSGAVSDVDNFSDTSDRHSEAGSMLSIDDTQPPGQSSVDPEISAVGDLDLDGRLSDVSDGGGAEIDSSVNSMMDQGQEKAPSSAKERLTKAVNRVQKLTPPKVGQASSLRPKPKDPSAPKSSVTAGARRSTTSQATPPARASGTSKRVP